MRLYRYWNKGGCGFSRGKADNLNANDVQGTNMGPSHRYDTLTALTKLTVRTSNPHLARLRVCSCSRKLNLICVVRI